MKKTLLISHYFFGINSIYALSLRTWNNENMFGFQEDFFYYVIAAGQFLDWKPINVIMPKRCNGDLIIIIIIYYNIIMILYK